MNASCRLKVVGVGMKNRPVNTFLLIFLSLFCVGSRSLFPMDEPKLPIIKKIIIEGNKHVKDDAILMRVPFKEGEPFEKEKTGMAINTLYMLGHFRQIRIEREDLDESSINLYIVLEERRLLEGFEFEGNTAIKTKKIIGDLGLDKLETVDEDQIRRIIRKIKDLYKDLNYHGTQIDYKIVVNEEVPDKARVQFAIIEGKRSIVKRVFFVGNEKFPDRKLRGMIFTREDWLIGVLFDAGKYDEEMVEMDKKRIEYIYRDHGYLMAKVVDAKVEFLKSDRVIHVTFEIKEGDRYTVRYINVPGDDLYSEDELIDYVELEKGKPFSQSKLVKSIERLKAQWGNLGYIYADVYPQIEPNEETKEVDITFHAEKGKKLFANRIDITGNKVTKDRVIRRELKIEEGDLITSRKLTRSKNAIEYLGFFEKGGVNWRFHPIAEDQTDLELNVSEAKTGSANIALSYGSDKGSASRSLRGSIAVQKSNFMGQGWDIGLNLQSSLRRFKSGSVYFFDPHIFDTDISTAVSLYHKQEEYDTWKSVKQIPVEKTTGASLSLGFRAPKISRGAVVGVDAGFEHIKNNNPRSNDAIAPVFQPIVDRTFQEGDHFWVGVSLSKDTRNHRVYPTSGYKIMWSTRAALPGLNQQFSFIKTEIDWSWYTPLIDEDKLVLMLHSHAGIIDSIDSCNKIIPYKELFHMGGPNTVRGFLFGEIEPAWGVGNRLNPIGARKSFQFNAELLFPLVPDYQMKGHLFYDAGAGWDTPKYGITDASKIKRDQFNLRHSVGFGLNITQPIAAKISWGYKLDRDRAAGETPSEFHLTMNTAW